jgi:hypothetical protein
MKGEYLMFDETKNKKHIKYYSITNKYRFKFKVIDNTTFGIGKDRTMTNLQTEITF